jgi:hypothetical protein
MPGPHPAGQIDPLGDVRSHCDSTADSSSPSLSRRPRRPRRRRGTWPNGMAPGTPRRPAPACRPGSRRVRTRCRPVPVFPAARRTAGHLQIAAGPGDPVELDQGHLHHRMPADLGEVHEAPADVVGRPGGGVGQRPLPRPAPAGHPRLDEVAEAVELMPPLEVAVAVASPRGVEVAVGLLRLGDDRLERVEARVVRPGHGLQQLVHLRSRRTPGPGSAHRGSCPSTRACPSIRAVPDDDLLVECLAVTPEAGGEPNGVEAERGQHA